MNILQNSVGRACQLTLVVAVLSAHSKIVAAEVAFASTYKVRPSPDTIIYGATIFTGTFW